MTPFLQRDGVTIYNGDVRAVLAELPAESVHCCVTSPPYWGLRDYGTATWEGGDIECDHVIAEIRTRGALAEWSAINAAGGGHAIPEGIQAREKCPKCGARRIDSQIGLEATPSEYVETLVQVFSAVRGLLRDDGTLWLNLGDSYNAYNGGAGPSSKLSRGAQTTERPKLQSGFGLRDKSLKPKDLVGIPWQVALALRDDGWYLRQDIIWAKPNPMPESVTDRCTKSHEYIFLLSKSDRYYYDQDAIDEPCEESNASRPRMGQGQNTRYTQKRESMSSAKSATQQPQANARRMLERTAAARSEGAPHDNPFGDTRNKRSVWTVPTFAFPGAHFAVFPPALIEPCILAGCPAGGVVLDPFFGSGTTGAVCQQFQRQCIGIDLNLEYCKLAAKRFRQRRLLQPESA